MPVFRRTRAAALLVVAALAVPGCEDKPSRTEWGRVSGQVMTLEARAPVKGARVVLFDPGTNAPASPVAVTDPAGRYLLEGVASGWYYLVTYAGRQVVYDPADQSLFVAGGKEVSHDVVVATYPYLPVDGQTVAGRVEDAATGAPLDGAFVSLGSTDAEFLFGGAGVPWETVTDGDGRFVLQHVPVAMSGRIPVGLYPVMAMRRGYRPGATGSTALRQWLPLPASTRDTVQVVIRLEAGDGSGRVRGRLLHGAHPVAGVVVALSLADTLSRVEGEVRAGPGGEGCAIAATMAAAGGSRAAGPPRPAPLALAPDLAVQSDPNGGFDIRHVPPGRYRLHAAYLPDDGWIVPPPDTLVPTMITIGPTRGDVEGIVVQLLPAVRIVSPAHGGVVGTGHPQLVWWSLPGATRYLVLFSRANGFILDSSVETADTSATVPSGFWGNGDHARWAVYAFRGQELVGATETVASLEVRSR